MIKYRATVFLDIFCDGCGCQGSGDYLPNKADMLDKLDAVKSWRITHWLIEKYRDIRDARLEERLRNSLVEKHDWVNDDGYDFCPRCARIREKLKGMNEG